MDDDGFDREKAKKKFMLPQAVILVAMAALVSFGAFTDESGAIVLNNILAVVLILVVAEVILYREVYVNSRSNGGNKGSSKNSVKSSGMGDGKNAGKKDCARTSVGAFKKTGHAGKSLCIGEFFCVRKSIRIRENFRTGRAAGIW